MSELIAVSHSGSSMSDSDLDIDVDTAHNQKHDASSASKASSYHTRHDSISGTSSTSSFFSRYLPSFHTACSPSTPFLVVSWRDVQYGIPRTMKEKNQIVIKRTMKEVLSDGEEDDGRGLGGAVPPPTTVLSAMLTLPTRIKSAISGSSTSAPLLRADQSSSSSSTTAADMADALEYLYALRPQSGLIYPGQLVYVLGSAGSGKTSLLRCLSGHALLTSQQKTTSKYLTGEIRYNGLTHGEAKQQYGFHIARYCHFVNQEDQHFSYLTVRETLQLAMEHSNANVELLASNKKADGSPVDVELLRQLQSEKVDMILSLFSLHECADSIVGNGSILLRGISGGQRRRLSIAEGMISNARLLCLDQATDGLDSAVAYQLITILKQWCKLTGTTVVMSLAQIGADIFDVADQIIYLREGAVIYNGPPVRESITTYFSSIGWIVPSDEPLLHFLCDLAEDPVALAGRLKVRGVGGGRGNQQLQSKSVATANGTTQNAENGSSSDHSSSSSSPASVSPPLPLTTLELHRAYNSSSHALRQCTYRRELNSFDPDHAASDTPSTLIDSKQLNGSEPLQSHNFPSLLPAGSCSLYTRAQYYSYHSHPSAVHIALNTRRQWLLFRRNWLFFIPRIGQAISVGFLLGFLYFQLTMISFQIKLLLIVFIPTFLAFANISELPWSTEALYIIYKQMDNRFYHPLHYIVSVTIMHSVLILLETFLFGCIIYFLSGFYLSAGYFLAFYFVLVGCNYSMSSIFRLIAFITPNADVAQQLAAPATALCLLFAGMLITYDLLPDYMKEFFWFSPMSWTVRALATSEFHSPVYTISANMTDPATGMSGVTDIELGPIFLSIFHIDDWVASSGRFLSTFYSIAYLMGFFLVFSGLTVVVLMKIRVGGRAPTQRTEADEFMEQNDESTSASANTEAALTPNPAVAASAAASQSVLPSFVRIDNDSTTDEFGLLPVRVTSQSLSPTQSFLQGLTFLPVPIIFSNISLTLLPQKAGLFSPAVERKQILTNLSGYFAPGTLTALMGGSGAGKTTLLNVIANKISGMNCQREGEVKFGKLTLEEFTARNAKGDGQCCFSYVEQMNTLMPYQTVRECLRFSALLRLSPSDLSHITDMETYIAQIILMMDLTDVCDHLVGDSTQSTLSIGQIKRVCIGIELAANPSILFCDEPTTGLDQKSAMAVVMALKRVARTGRTVVATIHQPSEWIFAQFDRLFLLQSGGCCSYFGPVGSASESVARLSLCGRDYADSESPDAAEQDYRCYPGWCILNYFQNELTSTANDAPIPLASPFVHAKRHIGDWMIHNLALAKAQGTINYPELYRESKRFQSNKAVAEQFLSVSEKIDTSSPSSSSSASSSSSFQSHWRTFRLVQGRLWLYYNRDYEYHYIRWLLSFLLSLFYGACYFHITKINPTTHASILSTISAQFMSMGFTAVLTCASSMPIYYKLRFTFYEETKSLIIKPYYPSYIYSLALTFVDLPFLCINSFFAILPFYYMSGLHSGAVAFLQYFLVDFLMSVCFCSWGQLLCALIPNLMVSNIVMGASFSMLFLFGTIPISPGSIPLGFQWLYHLLWLSKGVLATQVILFKCEQWETDPISCPQIQLDAQMSLSASSSSSSSSAASYMTQHEYVATFLDITLSDATYWLQILYLFITWFVLRGGVATLLHKLHWR